MARKKQHTIPPEFFVKALLMVGALWIIIQGAVWLGDNAEAVGVIIALAAVLAGALVAARLARRRRTWNAIIDRATTLADEHRASLVRKHAQLARRDGYGGNRADDWNKEIRYFIAHYVEPRLTREQRRVLDIRKADVLAVIDQRVSAAVKENPAFTAFTPDMSPAEFETFCADELKKAGWTAHVTAQTRDQGVDVIAEKDGFRIVLQCKLYGTPVGNKAVQEAAAARDYEKADFAAVVSNQKYTPAAERLAGPTRVLLLHYSDLRTLDRIVLSDQMNAFTR